MRPFDKPALTIKEQLQLLKERGLTVADDTRASRFLEVVSLFRLSPYMRPFQHAGDPDHAFRQGATLREIVTVYRFDRELRNLVVDALERVEVAVRASITNHMASSLGDPHWYLKQVNFNSRYDHKRLITELDDKLAAERRQFAREVKRIQQSRANTAAKKQRIERRKRDNYFRYYGQTYNTPALPPSWAVLEELSLGALSRLYQGIALDKDRKAIASRFGLPQEVLGSWLHTFTFVRNCCAHHARLWNRELAISPKLPRDTAWHWPKPSPGQPNPERRLFVVLLMLAHLMRNISPDSQWQQRLEALLEKYDEIPLRAMGFIVSWRQHPVWASDKVAHP
jgi:abortive infection bacteriophage resistance protein